MRKFLGVWEDLDAAHNTIARLEAELAGCRKICDDLHGRRTKVMDENVHLRQVIEDAPHDDSCVIGWCQNCEVTGPMLCDESDPENCPDYKPHPCNCWKSRLPAVRSEARS